MHKSIRRGDGRGDLEIETQNQMPALAINIACAGV